MEENNKETLDKLIAETLHELEMNPGNKELLNELKELTQISIKDYAVANKAYNDELKITKDAELREAELAAAKKDAIWNRVLKGLGILAPFTVGMATIHADKAGEFIHKIALPWASKFGKD